MARHQSDLGVKEHLITRMNDLDKQVMEKSTELLFQKRRVGELTMFKQEFDQVFNAEKNQRKELELRSNAEILAHRKRNQKLLRQNRILKSTLRDFTVFFQNLEEGKQDLVQEKIEEVEQKADEV